MNNLGNKQTMAKNIKYYMDKNNLTRKDLCEAIGVKYTTLTDWVKANSYPRIDKIEMMANYFGIEKSDLVEERIIKSSDNTIFEKKLLKAFDSLTSDNKKKSISYTENLLANQKLDEELETANRQPPLLQAAHARTDIEQTPEGIAHDLALMEDDSNWE